MAKSVKGDSRSANLLLNIIFKVQIPTQIDEIDETLPDDDLAIIEGFKKQVLDTAKTKGMKND